MQIRPGQEEAYAKYRELNTKDGYSAGVVHFTERWADLMEKALAESRELFVGEKYKTLASTLSHEANTEGITGFMYGCAVSILSQVWEHGEALRLWHNTKTQIGTEGDEANETGSVLNPALLSIG